MRRSLIALQLFSAVLVLCTVLAANGCGQDKTVLRIISAGSFLIPLETMEQEFEALHPDVDVAVEGHGSIQVIRYVTEMYHEADVLIVADRSLIPMMMYNTTMPESDDPYADWHLSFATNSLGLAYTDTSAYSAEINQSNWYEILARPDVTVGVSDARIDSCGYRAMMLCQLAEAYYGNDSIFDSILGDNFILPVTTSKDGDTYTISVPEVLEPLGNKLAVRGNSIWLLFLLDSGDADYAFEYRSVALQHGYEFLELPPQIDLSSEVYAGLYGNTKVMLDFRRFGSVEPVFTGEPIIYGMTIPNNAPNPDLAVEFIEFVFSAEGQQIMLENEQPVMDPPVVDSIGASPDEITQHLNNAAE